MADSEQAWSIRPAVPEDAEAWLGVHQASMAQAYPGMPAEFLAARRAGRRQLREQLHATLSDPQDRRHLIATDAAGAAVGIGQTCRGAQEWERRMLREGYPELATGTGLGRGLTEPPLLQLTTLYTLGTSHGSGLGQAMARALLTDEPCYLWIMAGNDRAAAFYRRPGFVRGSISVPSGPTWYAWPMYQMVRARS